MVLVTGSSAWRKAEPIFVGGLMKSGTSLARALIANHPRIFGGLETWWFSDELARDWQLPGSRSVSRLLRFYSVSEPEYAAIRQLADSVYSFVDLFMGYCTQRAGKHRWVEKTPANVSHLPLIFKHWPDAKMVHVVRDPRDVYASWKKNAKYSLPEFIAAVRGVENNLAQRLGNGDERYIEVKYAELVACPKEVMERTMRFVGEHWIDGLEINQSDLSEFEVVKAATGVESATLKSLARPVFTDSVGQWRKILSKVEQELIERELKSYCEKTGCLV